MTRSGYVPDRFAVVVFVVGRAAVGQGAARPGAVVPAMYSTTARLASARVA